MTRILPNGTRVELMRSFYGTWIVRVNNERRYESTNKTKALGVLDFLSWEGQS